MKKFLFCVLISSIFTSQVAFANENIYNVKLGDTLYSIARNVLFDQTLWKDIYSLNSDQISNPNNIYIDQQLTLPNVQKSDNFFTTSDGVEIYYEVVGTGEPILFVHGGGVDSNCWRTTFESTLKDSHQLIRVDLRSNGKSSHSLELSPERNALDIKELIDHLNLEDVLLVGHSMGGALSSAYAEETDDYKLRGIILVDAALSTGQFNFNDMFGEVVTTDVNSKNNLLLTYVSNLYAYDTLNILANRNVPVAVFSAESAFKFLDINKKAYEILEGNNGLTYFVEFVESKNHNFHYLENEKFIDEILYFDNQIS